MKSVPSRPYCAKEGKSAEKKARQGWRAFLFSQQMQPSTYRLTNLTETPGVGKEAYLSNAEGNLSWLSTDTGRTQKFSLVESIARPVEIILPFPAL
jgi:hypothetical protein